MSDTIRWCYNDRHGPFEQRLVKRGKRGCEWLLNWELDIGIKEAGGECVIRESKPLPVGDGPYYRRDDIDYEAAENIIGPITSSGFSGKYLPEVVRQAVDAALRIGDTP